MHEGKEGKGGSGQLLPTGHKYVAQVAINWFTAVFGNKNAM